MDSHDPALQALVHQVQEAAATRTPLFIQGGGSKGWSVPASAAVLSTLNLRGISSHEPTELVVTARAGTPLVELETALAAAGQCLAFEPPRHPHATASSATVGGMVASGWAGPSRATAGGVRDHVLGATVLNGRGEVLSFGGQVMKNVAGYDVSRLMAGSLGVLGVLLEVSLKVMPRPPATATLRFDLPQAQALQRLQQWGGLPLPLSGSAWWEGVLVLRLSGAQAAVDAARKQLGGEPIEPGLAQAFWTGLRDQHDEFFVEAQRQVEGGARLWRLSVPATTPVLDLPGSPLVEWGGALRWCVTPAQDDEAGHRVARAAAQAGGHAQVFRGPPLGTPAWDAPTLALHRQLKQAFDPLGLFNQGRLHPDF